MLKTQQYTIWVEASRPRMVRNAMRYHESMRNATMHWR